MTLPRNRSAAAPDNTDAPQRTHEDPDKGSGAAAGALTLIGQDDLENLIDELLYDEPRFDGGRRRCRTCLRPMHWDDLARECAVCRGLTCDACEQPCIQHHAWDASAVYRTPSGRYRCAVCAQEESPVTAGTAPGSVSPPLTQGVIS